MAAKNTIKPKYTDEEAAAKRAIVLNFLEEEKQRLKEKEKQKEAKKIPPPPPPPPPAPSITPKPQLITPNPAPLAPLATPVADVSPTFIKAPAAKPKPVPLTAKQKEKNAKDARVVIDFLEDVEKEAESKAAIKPAAQAVEPIKKGVAKSAKQSKTSSALVPPLKPILPVRSNAEEAKIVLPKPPQRKRLNLDFGPIGYAMAIIVIMFSSYVLFCLTFYTFKPTGRIARTAANFVSVPAVISTYGVIDYFEYYDLRNALASKGVAPAELDARATIASIEWQVVSELARFYSVRNKNTAVELLDALGKAVVGDPELNASAYSSIRKVKNGLTAGQSLEQASAAEGGNISTDYYSTAEVSRKFGRTVISLTNGSRSGIIVAADGFYIVEMMSRKDNNFELKTVHIKPKTLTEIVNDKLAKAKAINLLQ
ncbi:hypothetical protein HGA64_03115 [Candidatus Falkowbacteria bacterium]|nr:hypothetical protein [Candidatus Falkowbacteria bacterium]